MISPLSHIALIIILLNTPVNIIIGYFLGAGMLLVWMLFFLIERKAVWKGLFGNDGIQFIELGLMLWLIFVPVLVVSNVFLIIDVPDAVWYMFGTLLTVGVGGKIANDKVNKNGNGTNHTKSDTGPPAAPRV